MAGAIPWLAAMLYMLSIGGLAYIILQALRAGAEAYSAEFTAASARQLDDVFLFIPPRRILDLAAGCASVCFLVVFLLAGGTSRVTLWRGLLLGLAAGGLGWMLPRQILNLMKRRRLRRFNEQLVDCLMNMSNALRAGFSIQQAIESIVQQNQSPISQEFAVFMHQMRVGVRMEEAFRALETRVGSEDLSLMVQAVETARQTGGNLTEVFERIAHTIRERMRIERRIRTLTAMGRLQGIVIGAVPFFLLLMMYLLDARMMRAFFHSTAGAAILSVAAVLEALGALLIRKIIRIDV